MKAIPMLMMGLDKGSASTITTAEFHAIAVRQALEAFNSRGTFDAQFAFLWRERGEIGVVVTPWRNEEDKQLYLAFLRTLCDKTRPDAYSTSSEVWFVDDSPDPAVRKLSPSERSDRQESLDIITIDRDGKQLIAQFLIERTETEVTLRERENEAGLEMSGRMTELLR